MSKDDRDWLLHCPVSDGNWKDHLKSAALSDLRYVLRKWGTKSITGRRRIEARIRRLEKGQKREFSQIRARLQRAAKAASKSVEEFTKAAMKSGLSMKVTISEKDDE